MTKYFRCRRCGFMKPVEEMMILSLMELAGVHIDKRLKYCNAWEAEDKSELIEHDFEIIEVNDDERV